jgi:hypothetical protein
MKRKICFRFCNCINFLIGKKRSRNISIKDIELDDDFIEDLTEAFLDKNNTKEKKINFNISPINNLFEEKYYRKDELEKIGLITEKYILNLIDNEFNKNNSEYKEIYNKEGLFLAMKESGTVLNSIIPVIKMIYTIPKSEFKKGTTQKNIIYTMRDPEARMKWDKKFKEFYTMENGKLCKIVYSRMNRPIFFISERDTIEKRYEFYYNNNYYSYTSSVEDNSCEKFNKIEDVERLINYFSTYTIEEDDNNFYFKTLNQLDYKMNTPNQLLGVTLPTNLKDWYKKLRESVNNSE